MSRLYNIGSALSRLLNAATGGNTMKTFSASSYEAYLSQKPWHFGNLRVAVIDALLGKGHCYEAYIYHKEKLR